ncbi:MAG: 2,3-bisphosphoglycerate-independent phosphoglycerate mutase [Firmicutes bacterium]|nr:2,3-bisphosphoglycerate-independent phosphoglycerate mutase [Bacillota bacterium]
MVTLLILDGYGIGEKNKNVNAIYHNSPNMDNFLLNYPSAKLVASGEGVGLSKGQMGNSETGHLNIGAGRIVYQSLSKIDNLIKDDKLKDNETLLELVKHINQTGGKVHLMGLLSDGGVHSHINHLKYLLKFLSSLGCKLVLHCFLDGRDTKVDSGIEFLKDIQDYIISNNINCEIADIVGRVYAMDREKRFDRVQKAYDMLVGKEEQVELVDNLLEALKKSYDNNFFDEFVKPIKMKNSSKIEDGDAILSFNFRTDRMRELISAFGKKDFNEFETIKFENLFIATMTQYDKTFDFAHIIIPEENIKNCLSKVLSDSNKTQFRVSETTKYAHITFFFNGQVEKPYKGENRMLIDSINTQDFSKFPKMRAREITKKACDAILSQNYDFVLINLSNPDMIGHTGNLKATKKAIKFVDKCVKKLVDATLKVKSNIIITADHGNAELMIDEKGKKVTSHTTNLVPIVLVGEKFKDCVLKDGKLSDIAPTILQILDIEKPVEMTGESLIQNPPKAFYVCPSTDPVNPEDKNFEENLIEYAKLLQNSGADFLHCDIMDGKFVERRTYNSSTLKLINDNTTIPLDVHLMTQYSNRQLKKYLLAGADILTLHIENFIKNNKLQTNKIKKIAKFVSKNNCLFGLSIKPDTNIKFLDKIFKFIDLILVMSVQPGKSGQKFLENTYDRVKYLDDKRKNNNLKFLIEVDGGVNPEISQKLKDYEVDMVVSGNYVFKSDNKQDAIKSLK